MTNEENKYLEKLYELRKLRKADSLCVNCSKPLDREGYYCKKCNEKYNENKYNYAHQNHADNKCSTCAKHIDREGWLCNSCARKRKLHARERSVYRRENGLCVQCG